MGLVEDMAVAEGVVTPLADMPMTPRAKVELAAIVHTVATALGGVLKPEDLRAGMSERVLRFQAVRQLVEALLPGSWDETSEEVADALADVLDLYCHVWLQRPPGATKPAVP